jgi:hypothetical protein
MPKLLDAGSNMQTGTIPGLSGYQFSAVRPDGLGASEYTLVTIAVDTSTSVSGFRALLVDTLEKAVDGCRKSPRANNLLVRAVTFANAVTELHGFKPLAEIKPGDYASLRTGGSTALYDAAASSVGAMAEYGRVLSKQDFGVNGILFVITDGCDNVSTYTAATVRAKVREALQDEVLESFVSVLVGVNAQVHQAWLDRFSQEAGFTAYKDAGDATPGNLAKLAQFVSRSVSSQAGAQGTGAAAAIPASAPLAI